MSSLLRGMPDEVEATFTKAQLTAIVDALDRSGRSPDRPLVNIRTAFSLYFTRVYCVFIFGRDRRERQQHVELERRTGARSNTLFFFGTLGVLALLGVAFAFLYYLKRVLEIDLIDNWHLQDIFESADE